MSLAFSDTQYISLREAKYPTLLRETPHPPKGLYVRGNASLLADDVFRIGVVGTRKLTRYGEEVTEKLTTDLVSAGFIIVSGMALGVDSVSHKTTINCGGKTIAVLGCGIDVIYPSANTHLYWDIVKNGGCIVTEFPPRYRTTTAEFTSRNRIISGLSLGVVVTEGAERSGTMITASYAAQQGREVFAVPGPITSEVSLGTARLIQQGAKLVINVSDILEELQFSS